MTVVALDIMGGDHSPEVTLSCLPFLEREKNLELILVGRKEAFSSLTIKSSLKFSFEEASEVIEMDESPSTAFKRKPNSSIHVGLNLVKSKKADAFVSAGNTGAVMTASLLILGRIKGVDRPAICTLFPTQSGRCVVLDVGSNVDCKPQNLYQFALMGHFYADKCLGVNQPRVGLLNIGEEEEKGNQLTQSSYKLLKQAPLNFVGNIEGKDLFYEADVVVCDGFLGNAILKFGEGLVGFMFKRLKDEISKSWLQKLGALLVKPAFRQLKKQTDYEEIGGAPLLGLKGVSIIAHGKSKGKAIANAIRAAKLAADQQLVETITSSMRSELPPKQVEQDNIGE